ncbi:MAG: polysaccharide biosynthesis protein [Clostridiales bacterium]|nr:polysaccharide biosynthesis protein [Clostridiales bacterium]
MSSLNTKEQSIGKGFVVLSAANIAVKVVSLLFVPFLNKILGGEAGYSVYYSANQVFAFVYVLTTAGLPVAISKLVTELTSTGNRKQAKQAFRMARTLMVLLGVALSVIMAIFAKPIARYMNNEDSWMGILTLAPTVLICSLLSAYRGYLQGMKNMTPTAVSQVVEQIVHVAVSVVLVLGLRSRGIVWAVAGASIGTAVGAAAALIIVIKYYGQYQQDQRVLHAGEDLRSVPKLTNQKLLKLILYYSLPITINSGIQYGGNMIDTSIMKGRLMAAGLNEYDSRTLHGMMGVTRQLLNVPTALVTSLCISLLPVIAGLYAQKKYAETRQKANYAFKLCYIIAVPLSIAMCVYAEPLYVMLGLGSGAKLLSYMSFSILLLGTVHLQSSVMQSVNELFSATLFMGIGVLVKAVLNYILIAIPSLNIYGAVISTYVSYIIPLILNHICLVRKRGVRIKMFQLTMIPMICGGLMLVGSMPVYLLSDFLLGKFAGTYVTETFSLILAAAAGIVVYFYAMKKTGGMDSSDFSLILPAHLRKKLKL